MCYVVDDSNVRVIWRLSSGIEDPTRFFGFRHLSNTHAKALASPETPSKMVSTSNTPFNSR